MTDISRDLADIKTGNISLQPIKEEAEQVIKPYIPLVFDFPPPPDIPDDEFQNGTFLPGSEKNDLLSTKGIQSARPELIAVTKFEPCYESANQNTTPIFEMLKTQIAIRRIREENLKKFLEYLRDDSTTKPILDELLGSFNENINLARRDIELSRKRWADFDTFIATLDMHQQRGAVYDTAVSVESNSGKIYTLNEVLTKQGFNADNIKFWTNTKVIGQLLLDLSFAFRRYTLGLFTNSQISSRKIIRSKDNDPFTYASYADGVILGSTFNAEAYVNDAAPRNGFNEFRSKGKAFLPNNRSDRLKFIATRLSRMLGGSRVYSLTPLRNNYLNIVGQPIVDTKNFVSNLIGGTTTIAGSVSQQSTMGILRVITTPNQQDQISNTVLPLERRDVSYTIGGSSGGGSGGGFGGGLNLGSGGGFGGGSGGGITVINAASGYDYFFTGLNNNGFVSDDFNRTRMNSFKSSLNTKLLPALDIIDVACLTNSPTSRQYSSQQVFDTLRADQIVKNARNVIIDGGFVLDNTTNDGTKKSKPFRAIFHHAYEDHTIKMILFQALLLRASFRYHTATDENNIFVTAFKNEIDTFVKFGITGVANITNSTPTLDPTIGTAALIQKFDPVSTFLRDRFITRIEQIFSIKLTGLGLVNIRNQYTRGIGINSGLNLDFIIDFINNVESVARNTVTNANTSTDTTGFAIENSAESSALEITNANGTTKYLNMSSSMRIFLYLELFITLIGSYPLSKFNLNQSLILISPQDADNLINHFKNRTGTLTNVDEIAISQLQEDRVVIRSMISLLRAHVKRINQVYNNMGQGVVVSTIPSTGAVERSNLLANDNVRRIMVSKQQTALSLIELDDVLRSTTVDSIFSGDDVVTPSLQKLLLEKLLNFEAYKRKGLLNILTVGLCPGTNSIIESRDKTTRSGAPKRNWRQSDIVTVDVHIKNILEEDIIFKPRKFHFELSRFVNMKSFDRLNENVVTSTSYDNITREWVDFIDVSVIRGDNIERAKGNTNSTYARYQFIQGQGILNELYRNHTTSYLLGLYIKLLTGIDTRESAFLFEPEIMEVIPSQETSDAFKKLSEILISRNSPTLTLQQFTSKYPQFAQKLQETQTGQFGAGLFEDAKILDPQLFDGTDVLIAQDLYDISKLMGAKSTLTGGEKIRQRLTSPKLFERIFNVPVYLPNFEIDLKRTQQTSRGQNALSRLGNSNSLIYVPINNNTDLKVFFKWDRENMRALQMWASVSTIDV